MRDDHLDAKTRGNSDRALVESVCWCTAERRIRGYGREPEGRVKIWCSELNDNRRDMLSIVDEHATIELQHGRDDRVRVLIYTRAARLSMW